MKRRVEAHFGFIVGLMAQHEACLGDAYFTPRGQSYPQAGADFQEIVDGLSAATIVN
jgi:xylose isomerase